MEKEEKNISGETKQTSKDIKDNLPEKNAATDNLKNSSSELGLNQTKTTQDDLMPSDGGTYG